MDEKELITLLRSGDIPYDKRGWRCPDDNQIAAYVSNGPCAEREKLEAPFAGCKSCLATLSFLTQEFLPAVSVPPQVLNRGRNLTQSKQLFAWNWRWGFAAASACVLIIAAFLVWQIRSRQTVISPDDLLAQRNEPSVT